MDPISSNDHNSIVLDLKFKIPKLGSFKRTIWDFSSTDFNAFREALNEVDFSYCEGDMDIDTIVERWVSDFLGIINTHVVHKTVLVRPSDKIWFNGYLRRLKRIKNRKHKRAKKINSDLAWAEFRAARNTYLSEIKRIKKGFEMLKYEKLVQNSCDNPKK